MESIASLLSGDGKLKRKSTKSIIFAYDLKISFTRLKRFLKREKMTLNLPVTYARIRLILSVGEYFVQPISFHRPWIIESLMIQQWGPSLNNKFTLSLRNCSHRESLKTYKNMHITDGRLFTLKMTFNSCYYSWACGQISFCLERHASEAGGSIPCNTRQYDPLASFVR